MIGISGVPPLETFLRSIALLVGVFSFVCVLRVFLPCVGQKFDHCGAFVEVWCRSVDDAVEFLESAHGAQLFCQNVCGVVDPGDVIDPNEAAADRVFGVKLCALE